MRKKEEFARVLKQLREEKNIKQKDLARWLDVDPSTVSAYERGTRSPSRTILQRLSELFQVSVDALLGQSLQQQLHFAGPQVGETFQVPLLGMASAGLGIDAVENAEEFLPCGFPADFALRVHGESMVPLIPENAVVFVRKVDPLVFPPGKTGVVLVRRDEGMIKHVFFHENGVWLLSENPFYPPLFFDRETWDNECALLGQVIGFQVLWG
ncbi:MAG TPA: LexA family transcriptional regulator [Thermotogota bacterium]|nr:LexA family transcriptional regulator [Thermotogota bacterium]HRW92306.1 LexA family transcriptional regulator [Thermotogota bacterium]